MYFRKIDSLDDLIKVSNLKEDVIEGTGYFTSSEHIIERASSIMKSELKELLELPLEKDELKILFSKIKDYINTIENA